MMLGGFWKILSLWEITFGIVYRKACVLEFRYRKSTQNLDINRLPSFEPVSNPEFGRFLLETKIMGLEMGINGIIYTAYSKFHIFHWLQIGFFSNVHFARVYQVYCLQYLF
jgi:hypothetical protein